MNHNGRPHWLAPLMVAIIATIITLALTFTYVNGALQGKFQHIFLPSKVFGVPERLAAHGYETLFNDGVGVGWDGQFYFSIANDPLAKRDTRQHIDYDAYRYQRIGLPLMAAVVAKLSGQDWVSPRVYYLTSLFILFAATWVGAAFFKSRGINPAWMLIWTLSMGTQITQLHGLPDAAADGLLIMALIALLNQYRFAYLILAVLAALTRETYVLFPISILCAGFVIDVANKGLRQQMRPSALTSFLWNQWHHLPAIIAFTCWQLFIRHRFETSPSAQAKIIEILDWPFKYAVKYMLAPFTGGRPMDRLSEMESAGILLFLMVLLTALCLLSGFMRSSLQERKQAPQDSADKLGIGAAFIVIAGLYFCFGHIVMMDNTGYWKAASIFLFLLPFVFAVQGRKLTNWPTLLLLVSFVLFGVSLLARITTRAYVDADVAKIDYAQTEPACLDKYDAQIRPLGVETVRGSWWQRLNNTLPVVVIIEVTNTGKEDFFPYRGKGSVAASYQWISVADGSVALDGLRTLLPKRLPPQQSIRLPLRVMAPQTQGKYVLKLSLVQEGCTWFHNANPASSFNINYDVR
ncbi:DUF3307 domain-containing protein [Herbaspirillum rubrisubalbicans]|uniref:DUF3307 domain-containing protein n=1 Tax=Herbaspirillum rubrisubalbicans TaxID=80842 RepID=UPI001559DB10|nr:DUF3307 domain-containing protein [Herbaspirillum rubrisubalbicans]NQE51538.1 hypothetical protein [Herbaspirillum rubrisubalbicans]